MTSRAKRPAIFSPDDPNVTVTALADEIEHIDMLKAASDDTAQLPAIVQVEKAKKPFAWRNVLLWAAGGLISLAAGLAVTSLIESLFARFEFLGWLGLSLAALVAIALLAILAREWRGLSRLAEMETLRQRAAKAIVSDDLVEGRAIVRDLIAFERSEPNLARARTRLETHLGEIIDGADLIRLAERELMTPLDREARRLVSAAAKRVSIVTAISPRAAVDIVFVLITALSLARRLALLYGGRPGTLGLLRLARHVVSHLAITGGMAASDSLIQQVIGHGVAAKLSARLGEGVLNGLLTARLGLAAIDVTRPLPFTALPRPTLSEVAGGVIRSVEPDTKT